MPNLSPMPPACLIFCLVCSRALLPTRTQVRAEDVHLPVGATFVIANSLTVSKKKETADKR